jgi:hypothetical protein
MTESRASGLTEFQAEVARLFFSLPESAGFSLAGAGALLAQGLTCRPTEDGWRARAHTVRVYPCLPLDARPYPRPCASPVWVVVRGG